MLVEWIAKNVCEPHSKVRLVARQYGHQSGSREYPKKGRCGRWVVRHEKLSGRCNITAILKWGVLILALLFVLCLLIAMVKRV
ncbi:MAG: hypothetical protein DWQ35_13935 [Planctomycetota bacterium]|nr:MAG: hypothetical protein DWQ35_13935 [Planctomycetota bacterium]REK25956.1 MAG: hypothetical protein DWQ42_10020 [Planctomycetota bacterium]REK46928.1 MAG: hypothetical protein DWQ46_05380 [Planctomycetota bacterium]